MLAAVARLALVIIASGTIPNWFVQQESIGVGVITATRTPAAVVLVRAVRASEGRVLTRNGVRVDGVGRWTHVGPGLFSSTTPSAAPRAAGAVISREPAARVFGSPATHPLRGPPPSA